MEFVGKVCYLQLIMYQLYRYCIKGNDVTEHSLAISDAIYCCEWIAADDSIQKSLKLMIMRAQRPIKFTAAKFMSLSLGTFMAVSPRKSGNQHYRARIHVSGFEDVVLLLYVLAQTARIITFLRPVIEQLKARLLKGSLIAAICFSFVERADLILH